MILKYPVIRAARIHATGVVSGNAKLKLAVPTGPAFEALLIKCTSKTNIAFTATGVTVTDGTFYMPLQTWSTTLDFTGTGAGKLDTGSLAANTWYYIWAIYDPALNAKSAVGSTASAWANVTAPSGYTFAKLVGAVRSDATAAPNTDMWKTYQYQDVIWYVDPGSSRRILSGGTATTWTSWGTINNYIPSAKSKNVIVNWRTQYSSGVLNLSNYTWDNTTVSGWELGVVAVDSGFSVIITTLPLPPSSTAYYKMSAAGSDLTIDVLGWGLDI